MGTMDPTSLQNGSSRTFRASQGLGGKTGNAAYRSCQGPYRLLSTKGHHNCAFVGTTDGIHCWGGNNNWGQLDVPVEYAP